MQLLLNTILFEPNRWTADKRPLRPLAELLEAVAESGFRQLELWQYHVSFLSESGRRTLLALLRQYRLEAVALGAYPRLHPETPEERRELDLLVDFAAEAGCSTFKIFPGRGLPSAETDGDTRAQATTRLRRLAAALHERGLRLTLETHGGTLCDTLESTRRLLADLQDVENLGLCFQPYTDQGTEQALAMYDELAPRILHIHLQNRRSAERLGALLAEGDWIDYSRFLPHVKTSGFDGLLCLEFTADAFAREDGKTPEAQLQALANAVKDREFVQDLWNA